MIADDFCNTIGQNQTFYRVSNAKRATIGSFLP
jgi:hypothetical protein